jgi:hypothetical protein
MTFPENPGFGARSTPRSVVTGTIFGVLLGFVAIYLAILSSGAGHGNYAAARLLFPTPMLLTLIQGNTIGTLSMGFALLQFPFYGGLLGWTIARKTYLPAVVVGSLHLIALAVCFAGTLPNFS